MEPLSGALVLGLDSHGLALARALGRAGVAVYALEKNRLAPGLRSQHVRRVFEVADYGAETLLPALRHVRQALPHAQISLHATNDRQLRVLARHAHWLSHDYCVPWADAAGTVLAMLPKDGLQAMCQRQGLRYPRTLVLRHLGDLPQLLAWTWPLIIKPVQPLSSFKTLLVQAPCDLPGLMAQHAQALPFVVQEYIAGGDDELFFAALMLRQGQVVQGLAGHKLASHPPAQGQTTAAETTHNPEVLALAAQFFHGSDLSGPASVEFKRDAQGRYWVIEPTVGRTDFWLPLCTAAGFNPPLMAHQMACGEPLDLPSAQPSARAPAQPPDLAQALWFDTERDPLAYVKFRRCAKAALFSAVRLQFSYLSRDDWRPWLAALWQLVLRRWAHWQSHQAQTGGTAQGRNLPG